MPTKEDPKAPWIKYRDDLVTQKTEIERTADKTVFAISTGAIGVSLAIIDKLIPPDNYRYVYFILAFSWLFLVISIIMQATSFIKIAKKIGSNISKIDTVLNAKSTEELSKADEEYRENWAKDNKDITNYGVWAIRLMVLGISLLVIFSFLSLYLRRDKTVEPCTHQTCINK